MLVVISIDGLHPSHYLDPRGPAVTLHSYQQRGAFARSVQPVYPTVTFTNHVSLATGTFADRHRVVANTYFSEESPEHWENGESPDWILQASAIRVPTLWDIARQAGCSTALIRWPVTVGAEVDWLIPEVFPIGKIDQGESVWEMLAANSEPSEMGELVRALSRNRQLDTHSELDEVSLLAALYLIEKHRPDLIMIHFTMMDHSLHEHGTLGEASVQALLETTDRVSRLVSHLDMRRSQVAIVGDHGFLDFKKRIHINALLAHHGWIKAKGENVLDWQAIAHINCAQAPVYIKDPCRTFELLKLLRENANGLYRVLSRQDLRSLRTQPDAICAVDAYSGYSLGTRFHLDSDSSFVEEIPRLRGEHGYLPHDPRMHTGIILFGAGVPARWDLGEIHLTDVAPTLAGILGLKFRNADGKPVLSFEAFRSRRTHRQS